MTCRPVRGLHGRPVRRGVLPLAARSIPAHPTPQVSERTRIALRAAARIQFLRWHALHNTNHEIRNRAAEALIEALAPAIARDMRA